jgi:1-acyl-sn-glycerol-3-phosphate acyltransferase
MGQPGAWRVLADLALMAVFSGFFIVPLFALIQTRTAPSHRSRVIAANNILNAVFMVAAAVIGVLLLNVGGLSIPELLLVTALFNAAVAVYIYTLVPEFLMRFLSWILVSLLYRIKVEGLEKIPDDGAAVIVCNHVSYMDGMIVGGIVRRPIRFVMYYKIFRIPVLKFIFKTARAIPIAGRKEDPEMMERAFAEVDRELGNGELVAIFPEGALTRDGAIATFRPGVERILAKRAVPVIPMALRGMWGSMFSHSTESRLGRARVPKRFRAHIALVVGDPIPPELATAEYLEQKVRELRGDWA